MNYWLLKTEPGDYGYDDLEADGKVPWDGVRNNQALIFLRQMAEEDAAFIYHSGKQKSIVGTATIESGPYPDPGGQDDKLVVVDITAKKRLPRPVTLAEIKADSALAEFLLVRNSRLSVMPVTAAWWKKLCKMGGL